MYRYCFRSKEVTEIVSKILSDQLINFFFFFFGRSTNCRGHIELATVSGSFQKPQGPFPAVFTRRADLPFTLGGH